MRRITGLLVRGTGERFAFAPSARRALAAIVEEAAAGPEAVVRTGSLLKLVHVLRTQHASPSAAATLAEVLRSSPAAAKLIALHWAGPRRPRLGADLLPIKTERAPHVHAVKRGLSVASFLPPGQDLRSARLERAHLERKR